MKRFAWTIARHDLALLKNDPSMLVVLVFMPLVLMSFTKGTFGTVLRSQGIDSQGAEQAVPGMAVMFSFFIVTFTGYAIFREHGWNTWSRLRSSPARPVEIMTGKLVPLVVVSLAQQVLLLGAGGAVYGLTVRGSVGFLALVAVAQALALVSLGLLLTSVLRTVQQLGAIGNLLTILFAGLAGALVPFSALPGWARAVAPVAPPYWAMRGYQSVVFGDSSAKILASVAVLVGFTALFTGGAVRLWKSDDSKMDWI